MADQNIIKVVISGGFSNSDPALALGGLPSHVNPAGIIVSDSPINFFDTVDLARATAGEFQYLCMYVFGNNTEIGNAVRFWMDRDTFSDENEFAWGFESEANAHPYRYEPHMFFDGVTDFIDVPDTASLDLLQFSMSCWFRTSKDYSIGGIIGMMFNKGGTGSASAGENMNYGFYIRTDNKIDGGFEETTDVKHLSTTTNVVNDGKWHHYVVTYDQVNVRSYVDGVAQTPHATGTTPEINLKPLTLGKNSRAADRFFEGDLDEMYVWNNDLTAGEVTALYTSGTIPQESAIVYSNKFGNDNGSIIAQTIPNINTAPTGVTFNSVGGSPEDSIEFWNIPFKFLLRHVAPDNNSGDSYFAVWVRRRILANSKDTVDNKGIWKVSIELTRENTPTPTPNPDPVPDPDRNVITTYKYKFKWGSKGNGNGQFQDPHDIGFEPSTGNLAICDRVRNDIQKFKPDGTYLSKFGGSGSGNGQFDVPYACDYDSAGNIYVCDRENNRVQKLNASGTWISTISTVNGKAFSQPEDINFDKTTGDIYITDTGNNRVVKLTSAHTFILEWGKKGNNNGEFDHPHSIDTDSDGNVYVSCGHQPYIQKFDSSGNYIKKWGKDGTGDGETQQFLEHMDIDIFDHVHLINNDSLPVINVWDNEGNFITAYGKRSSGSANGQFKEPEHVNCDSTGQPYVVDAKNQRIQVFSVTVTEEGGGGTDPPQEADNCTLICMADTDCKPDTNTLVNRALKVEATPQGFLVAGDIQYGSNASCIFSAFGALDKIAMVAMGNHDDFNKYSGHYKLSKSYYSRVIQNIGIIAMDSESSFSVGSAQHTFVVNELQKFHDSATVDWIIVMIHRPFYSGTGGSTHPMNEGGKTDIYMPEFDKFGVDFILQGHNHDSQRSCQITYKSSGDLAKIVDGADNAYTKGKGRIFVVHGACGHDKAGSLYTIGTSNSAVKYEDDQNLQFFVLFFTGTNNTVCTGKFINKDGDIMDEFVVTSPV